MTVQNNVDRTETGQTNRTDKPQEPARPTLSSLPKDTARYWEGRLAKRDYVDRSGKLVLIPEWQIRLFHDKKEGWFNLGTANKTAAGVKARDIWVFLRSNGWGPTLAKFKPKSPANETKTIDDFAQLYRDALLAIEYPPSHQTAERYLKSLFFLTKRIGVTRISDLTNQQVKNFKVKYLKEGRREKRIPESVRVSCNAILRNAAALFSGQMLTEYKNRGLSLENPFQGEKIRRIKLKPYKPMGEEKLAAIWQDAIKLRDGDPNEPAPKIIRIGGRKAKKRPEDRAKRWKKPDLHSPQPAAYVLLLLELGLGLRRSEADRAEWNWLTDDDKGRHFLTVQETPYFKPKSRESRTIPVEQCLYDAILATRQQVSPFIVPGPLPKLYEAGKEPKNIVYRCPNGHRTLAYWLRQHGVSSDKPCHQLRKEFGSYVATSFGLFYAQRMLGHSSPKVTDAFYAGLVNLPELHHAKLDNGNNPQPAQAAAVAQTEVAR